MKCSWFVRIVLVLLASSSLAAFKADANLELQEFLQGRARWHFRGHETTSFSLSKGARGQVIEAQELNSGYGIKLLLTNGPHVGEKAWLFYSQKNSAPKLFTNINDFSLSSQTSEVEDADALETFKEELCYQEPRDAVPAKINGMVAGIKGLIARYPAADNPIPLSYQQALPFVKDAVSDALPNCSLKTLEGDANFGYCENEGQDHEFTLSNRGSPTINPVGGQVRREYTFSAPQSARQDSGLLVYEWGTTEAAAADSAWSMMTEIVFFPRKNLPAIRDNEAGAYELTLQTGEKVLFDKMTKEILGGVLQETAPIDMNANRQIRKFAALKYTGKGVMVRSDQRGESPRSSIVWGQKKVVTIYWGDKICKVSPADIWQQSNGEGGSGLYANDADFYKVLKQKCNWDFSPE